jgi:hypothetical protein
MVTRLLFLFIIFIIFIQPVSGINQVSNPSFEIGSIGSLPTDWIQPASSAIPKTSAYSIDGSFSAGRSTSNTVDTIYQYVDLTDVDTLSFYTKIVSSSGGAYIRFDIGSTVNVLNTGTPHDWTRREFDVSGYSGNQKFTLIAAAHPSINLNYYWDNFTADDGASTVEWNQSSYIIGDNSSINYYINGYDPITYDYSIDIFKGSSFMSYIHLSSANGNVQYSFSDVDELVTYYAKLTKRVNGSYIPLILSTDSCSVHPSDVSIVFEKSIYSSNDLVNMSYYNCPNGSRIIFRMDSSPWYDSKTYESISGNGSVSYQLSGAPAGIGYYAKVYSDSDIVIASDTMQIEGIVVGYCRVHGGIYDSQDYHPLIGTVFIGSSYSDVVGYSDYGAYSITVPWGTYNISAVVSSYQSYNSSNVEISGSDYNLDMFLSVTGSTTHIFRGSVTDADSNAAIEDVMIKVYNDTFDEYDFTSQSGVWLINGLTSGANYTLHATKDDYHSYTYNFMYDPGDFYHNFMMSLVVSEDDDTEDDVLEDALEEDESMTEYFDEKFRGFAPTIWGLFMCMCVLFFMSILTSFNSGGKRR